MLCTFTYYSGLVLSELPTWLSKVHRQHKRETGTEGETEKSKNFFSFQFSVRETGKQMQPARAPLALISLCFPLDFPLPSLDCTRPCIFNRRSSFFSMYVCVCGIKTYLPAQRIRNFRILRIRCIGKLAARGKKCSKFHTCTQTHTLVQGAW